VNNGGRVEVVWKELCDKRGRRLRMWRKAVGEWRYNLVRYRSGVRCCDLGRGGVVVMIKKDRVVCKIMG
jgi:hypothetical protein